MREYGFLGSKENSFKIDDESEQDEKYYMYIYVHIACTNSLQNRRTRYAYNLSFKIN